MNSAVSRPSAAPKLEQVGGTTTLPAGIPNRKDDRTTKIRPFTATIDSDGHVVLNGELDLSAIDALGAALDQALLQSGDVVIDVSGLSFLSSPAITELLRFQLRAAGQHHHLRLVRLSPAVARVVDILDLRHLLVEPVSEDADAVSSEAPR